MKSRENMLCLRPTPGVVHRSRRMNGYGIVDLVPVKRNSVLGCSKPQIFRLGLAEIRARPLSADSNLQANLRADH
jgi:hypothetical protein